MIDAHLTMPIEKIKTCENTAMNDIACESLWFFTAIKLVYDN